MSELTFDLKKMREICHEHEGSFGAARQMLILIDMVEAKDTTIEKFKMALNDLKAVLLSINEQSEGVNTVNNPVLAKEVVPKSGMEQALEQAGIEFTKEASKQILEDLKADFKRQDLKIEKLKKALEAADDFISYAMSNLDSAGFIITDALKELGDEK